ncbi:MAG TPA: carboxypeptidase-like regulatory domain-containing protein [Gemmata sp.]
MRPSRSSALTIAVALGALLSPGTARAHAMSATVEVRAEGVRVIVYFEDDLPADLATVSVTDATGTEVATGTTDERGVWSCAALAPGEYTLTAKSTGHVTTVTFSVAPPESGPAQTHFAAPRTNRALGLAVGAGGLLGLSALFWFFRRRP